MSAKIEIADDVRSVLTASTVMVRPEGCWSLKLPYGRLERELYIRVGKVISAFGGDWDRKTGLHLFERDPRPRLAEALETGQATNEKQLFQQFYTPAGLARHVADLAHITRGTFVLEPSAGEGALALAVKALGGRVHCIEIDPFSVNKLRALGFTTAVGDFLSAPAHPVFDRVVMNPPFSKSQDIRHVTHALKFLKPDGILVAIMSPTWENSELNPARVFRDSIAQYHGTSEKVAPGTFKESGTNVASVILRLQRRPQ